jgi:hypothetical protein
VVQSLIPTDDSPVTRVAPDGNRRMPTLRILSVVMVSICLLHGSRAVAQEGHPLKGSWVGVWGPSHNHSDDLFIVLDWDGKKITGMLNPGTDNRPIKSATLNPDGWIVRFEVDGTDHSGKSLHYVLEGKLGNLGSPERNLTGTWKSEDESGSFKITRQ